MSEAESVTASQLLLIEYEHVKGEQRARIGFRDNLLYATLASIAAVIAAVLQGPARIELLLLLPPVCLVLGWTYLINDEKISAIGRYVREELAPRLAAATTPPLAEAFGWERAHRSDTRRRGRKRLQLGVDLLAFCGAPAAALVVYWVQADAAPALLAVSVTEAAAALALAVQIAGYADLRTGGPEAGSTS